MTAETETRLYTPKQAGERLGVSHDVVDRWIRSGEIPFVDVGTPKFRRARIRESDLLALIERRTHTAPTAETDPLDRSA
jgi:excisionase family DNA binding protein